MVFMASLMRPRRARVKVVEKRRLSRVIASVDDGTSLSFVRILFHFLIPAFQLLQTPSVSFVAEVGKEKACGNFWLSILTAGLLADAVSTESPQFDLATSR